MLAVIFIVIVLFLILCWYKSHPNSPPTFPGELPIIGHAVQMIEHRNAITDPTDVGIVASACLDKAFFYKIGKDFVEKGLLTADAIIWKPHRKLINPAFNQQILNTYLNEMNVQARNLVSHLTAMAENGQIDTYQYLIQYVLRIVCRTSLGLESKDQNIIDTNYTKAIQEIFTIFCYRAFNPWLYPSFIYKRTALKGKEDKLIKELNNMINTVIQKRKSDLKSNNCITNNGIDSITGRFKPILDLLLHLADKEQVLTDDEIREHLDTIVIASYDTTSTVLQNILLVLGSYPEVQEKVYKEVQEVFQNNEDLNIHDLSKLVYMEAVIKEVLRVYDVVPVVARKLDTDIVLPKCTLKAGSTCILSLYGLHRHSSWGPEVNKFKPERWLNPATLPTNPNVYAAFSIGKRNCIGKQYAMMSLKISLAHVVSKFRISGDIKNIKWKFELVLKPTDPALIGFDLRS
ncbi:hypothetical protein HW555_010832 [Spodoptera exigua]|uniref:Cytochrome p450 n=1 Tax=Spodoptera exigua TaxID=7107 RepID=A0A835G9Q3_SPOEX|nr:hypothetical protein HW555_010832 [Spodoptera exigua]